MLKLHQKHFDTLKFESETSVFDDCLFFTFYCYFGIPEFLDSGRKSWTLGSGRWTLDAGLWTLDAGLWTLDAGLWTLDAGRWTLDAGLWTLHSGLWTLDSGLWTLYSGRWTLHLGSQALGTKHCCRLVQNKIRTQFLILLILQRVQVLTLNVKCYVKKENQNKFLLCEIELHHKRLSRPVQKQPSGAIYLQKFLQETPVVESSFWSNYRLTVQSSDITEMALPRILRKLSERLNIIDCKYLR